jgi:hypothetical protein
LDKSELYRGKSLEGIIKRIDDFIAERAGVIEGARVEQQELSLSWAKDKLQSYSKNRKRGDINRGNATSW